MERGPGVEGMGRGGRVSASASASGSWWGSLGFGGSVWDWDGISRSLLVCVDGMVGGRGACCAFVGCGADAIVMMEDGERMMRCSERRDN